MGMVDGMLNYLTTFMNNSWNQKFTKEQAEYQKTLDEQAQKNWQTMFDYTKEQNAIAQQNFETQMAFQQAQADIQQQQWQANRIGNLTKEYSQAGLSPLAAAGMGASTIQNVAMGGTPHFNEFGTNASRSSHVPAPNLQSYQRGQGLETIAELAIQDKVADANIEKATAEANYYNTLAQDISDTKDSRINKLKSEINLTDAQAQQSLAHADDLRQETKYKTELTRMTSAEANQAEINSSMAKIKWELIESYPEQYRQSVIQELNSPYWKNKQIQFDMLLRSKEFEKATVIEKEKLINEWFDSTIGLFGKIAGNYFTWH